MFGSNELLFAEPKDQRTQVADELGWSDVQLVDPVASDVSRITCFIQKDKTDPAYADASIKFHGALTPP